MCLCIAGHLFATDNHTNNNKIMEEKLNLTQEWDKTFPQSDKVNHTKITFHNRYGITLAADLYIPKNTTEKLPAIAISGPFGAVKEQASGFRSVIHRRKQWRTPLCSFSGYQYRGFLCSSRLPFYP